MAALKALVIGMAVVIVAGMGLVVYGMVRQADGLRDAPDVVAAQQTVPEACTLAEVTADGRGLLLLRLAGPVEQGCRAVLLFDARQGGFRGRIDLPAE
ncbi:hypothetical protein [Aquibaculum sediminis]|uniref:hypothetical protein n=1 Tax=Aquibaculum sediminis TaxID=3231907 RepID=UPI003452EF01